MLHRVVEGSNSGATGVSLSDKDGRDWLDIDVAGNYAIKLCLHG